MTKEIKKIPFTVKQLQGENWVIIWAGYALNKEEAKKKALKQICLFAEEETNS
jgi:hydrogenase maturation factor